MRRSIDLRSVKVIRHTRSVFDRRDDDESPFLKEKPCAFAVAFSIDDQANSVFQSDNQEMQTESDSLLNHHFAYLSDDSEHKDEKQHSSRMIIYNRCIWSGLSIAATGKPVIVSKWIHFDPYACFARSNL